MNVAWGEALNRTVSEATRYRARQVILPTIATIPVSVAEADAASHLRVLVTQDGREKVALSMPARTALSLEDVVPEDVQERLANTNENLAQIEARLRRKGLVKQELFEDSDAERTVRVWLE